MLVADLAMDIFDQCCCFVVIVGGAAARSRTGARCNSRPCNQGSAYDFGHGRSVAGIYLVLSSGLHAVPLLVVPLWLAVAAVLFVVHVGSLCCSSAEFRSGV